MGLHPDLEYYKYDLKENTARRMLAGLLDHFILIIPILIIGGVITVGLNSMNPLAALIGPLADIISPYEIYEGKPPSAWAMMLVFSVVHLIVTGFYFSFFESSGRRTFFKKMFHLEVLHKDGSFLTFFQAFRRNLLKFFIGAVAIYLLGIIGWAVLIGVTGLLDLKLKPGMKTDVRQRLTEVSVGSMVFLEDDDLPLGEINLPGEKLKTKKKGEGFLSKKMKTSIVMARKKGKQKLPQEKAPDLLGPGEKEVEDEEEIERAPGLSLETPEPEGKEEVSEPSDDEQEPSEKVPFWKKLFGGSKKKEEETILEQVPGPDDIIVEKEPEQLPARKEVGKDETVLQFMFDFDISEERAQAIYDMGYRNKAEFKDAIPQDLVMIKGINPTIAKRIVEKANEL